jgi:hypothetical protein
MLHVLYTLSVTAPGPTQRYVLDDPLFGLSSSLFIVGIDFRSHSHEGDKHIRDDDLDPLGLEHIAIGESGSDAVGQLWLLASGFLCRSYVILAIFQPEIRFHTWLTTFRYFLSVGLTLIVDRWLRIGLGKLLPLDLSFGIRVLTGRNPFEAVVVPHAFTLDKAFLRGNIVTTIDFTDTSCQWLTFNILKLRLVGVCTNAFNSCDRVWL